MKLGLIILLVAVLGAGATYMYLRQQSPETPAVVQEPAPLTPPPVIPEPKDDTPPPPPKEEFTFIVTVPQNTPEENIIYLNTHLQKDYPMEKVGPRTHQITLSKEILQPENGKIGYRYSRNGSDFITAEYLEPDTNDYFWTELGQKTTYTPEGTQEHTVERWRWLPLGSDTWSTDSALYPEGDFFSRVDNERFRTGQVIQDLYMEEFDAHFKSTAQKLKATGHTWVTLAPPWDCLGEGSTEGHSNYPNEEKFIEHVQVFKRAGLKVAMEPQIGCTEREVEKDNAYWENYFKEQEEFLVSQAKLAERAEVDAFYFSGFESQEAPFEVGERWRNIWVEIITVFSGKVGEHTWYFGAGEKPSVTPDLDYYRPWADLLDFFVFQTTASLSTSSIISDEELTVRATRHLEGPRQLYREFNKPVMVMTAYASVKDSWKGADHYSIDLMNAAWGGESEWQQGKYEFSGEDQARVLHAYWNAIKGLPWIIGFANFGYWHWAMPLAPGPSVREKTRRNHLLPLEPKNRPMKYILIILLTILATIAVVAVLIRRDLPSHMRKQQEVKQKRKELVLELLKEKKKITNDDVQKLFKVSDTTATRYMDELEQDGKIKQVGKEGRYVYYVSS